MRRLAAALLACCAVFPPSLPPPAEARDRSVLVLGRISDDPRSHYANLRPLLDYVVARMADLGIRRGEVLMAQNTAVMQSYLRAKLVDWISETPAQALRLEPAGARPLLLAERRGRLRYRTVFFARRDTGIVDLDGLVGRRLAVQSPASTSAFLVPLGMLMDRGLAPTLLPSPRVPAPPGAVGLLLAGSEHNIAVWVHKGLADAGAFSDHDFEDLERMPAALREDLVVFARSEPFPRAIELVREDLSAPVRDRLRAILLAAADDPEAAGALEAFGHTTRFHELDAATRLELDRLRPWVRALRGLTP